MKKTILIAAVFLFTLSPVFGARVGRSLVQPWGGNEEKVFKAPAMPFHLGMFAGPVAEVFYFNAEIERGNLRLLNVQPDPLSGMEHQRYQQYFSGLEVFGGEIIRHFKGGQLQDMDGEYYLIAEMELKPALTPGQAADFFRQLPERSRHAGKGRRIQAGGLPGTGRRLPPGLPGRPGKEARPTA